MGLQIQPDFGRPLEVAGEAQCGVFRDGSFALHDFIRRSFLPYELRVLLTP